ncbi:DUF6443 domain-containing protein, partial [Flavobacterium cupreum]
MKTYLYSIVLILMVSLGYGQTKDVPVTPVETSVAAPMAAPPGGGGGGETSYRWYEDYDGDGFGNPTISLLSPTKPNGYVSNQSDLDDNNAYITNIAPQTFYQDADNDTFGNPNVTGSYSVKPPGYVTNNSDYNDTTANITNIAPQYFYQDSDGDTFGNPNAKVYYSVKPTGYVTNSSDYNDTTGNITNIAPSIFYRDVDNDTFGNPAVTVFYSVKPTGYVTSNTDCNDNDVTLNPNTKWYADNDLDGLGDPAVFVSQCTTPAGNYVRNNTDNCPLVKGTNADCSNILTPSDYNYVVTKNYKKATTAVLEFPAVDQVQTSITYFDGLGRPVQQIANKQSANGKDIVTHITYDAFGRQVQEYLPYEAASSNISFVPNAQTGAVTFYNTAKYDNTANPFSQKKLESSPLNRVLKQAAPGAAWAMDQGHEIKLDYQTNTATEVKLYKATATWTPALGLFDIAFSDAGNYDASELIKSVTYDENTAATPTETAGSTVEFKNKEGQVVLKRTYEAGIKHDTYYVYDAYGNLTYVIPPKADAAITPAILDNLCYQYKYDYRNRLVEKKLPGKQWELIVYDKLDRPVATGPANSPFSDLTTTGWLITKYDALGRPVYTGWNNVSSTSATRKTLQDAQNLATVLFESKQARRTIDGVEVDYTNAIAPTTFKLLTVNYYDNYGFPGAQAVPAAIETQTVLTNVKTLPTGSWTRVPTLAAAVLAEISTAFYDTKAHPIRSYTANHLAGYTVTDSKLDTFSGQLQYSITKHKRSSLATDVEIVTKDAFTYSPQDRLLTQTHQINGGTIEVIANNTYDELGQLISKKVGNTIAAPTQKVDYTYNIRGWLTGINNTAALQQGSDPRDLFAFKINYNNTPAITGGKALYNGNIAETFWSSTSDATPIIRGYAYLYDNLNRLKTSVYKRDAVITNAYSENLTYDKNGNINSIIRNGNSETATQIDALVYTYAGTNTTNQLVKVVDNAPAASKVFGFTDSTANTVDDYSYDANGNMTKDSNKNITVITYNHLNLPTKITFATTGNIVYIYNASGQKVQKIVNEVGKSVVTTDYLGGYQYDNGLLKFFPTTEGYVEPSGSSYKYVYQYKDHLGNVRLSYDKTLVIKEESNFYPFGLKQEGYNTLKIGVENKYKYNGKELQDELGLNMYDYGARNYDPALGRWMNVDPLAEKYPNISPYVYVADNPINAIDPDGRDIIFLTRNDNGS